MTRSHFLPSGALNRRNLLMAGGLIAAVAIGFAVAKLTSPEAAAPAPPATQAADEHAPGEAGVAMTPQQIGAAGVQLARAAPSQFASEIVTQAAVEAAPNGQAVLTARASGAVSRINKSLGDPVRAGEIVALVESREASAIAADRSVAAAKVDLAGKVLARERRLFEAKVTARQDLEKAQADLTQAQAEARRATLSAGAADVSRDGRHVMVISPISGRVTAVSASLGAFVQPETELFRITDPRRIQIEAPVTVRDAGRVMPGDPAVIEGPTGASISAVVRALTPSLNEETRSATVVLSVTGGPSLQPGQLVRIRIRPRLGAAGSGLVVPEEAVQTVDGKDVVFVRTPNGFRPQAVTVARRSNGLAEIAGGLKGGEVVATRNAFLIKAELGKGEGEEH